MYWANSASACEPLSTLTENNFNDRGDSSLSWPSTYTYSLANGYSVDLIGWTHTRNYAYGFLTNTANTNPRAIVSGLQPGGSYKFKVYQYASAYAGSNSLAVNGVDLGSTSTSTTMDASADGDTTATAQGEITFTFTRVTHHVHLSGLAIGSCSAPAASGAAAVGDPHLQNIHGERFDLMKPGKHVVINIPRGVGAEKSLLHVQADARKLGGQCADMYFQELNVTGAWAEAKRAGGYHYSASQLDVETPGWVEFGSRVQLKVVHGRTDSGLRYLNVYVKHLGRAGFAVGGLLGEDDHG